MFVALYFYIAYDTQIITFFIVLEEGGITKGL